MSLYALGIFLSAFLLFQVQPMIARIIVPWFGGAAAVWTTCLLFFQTILLMGYAYAHASTRYLKPSPKKGTHLVLLGLSVLALPLLLRVNGSAAGNGDPTAQILALLLLTIGLPYLLLSTTSPLLQAWAAAQPEPNKRGAAPYRLYALSNAGSLLALLGYPIFVEPNLTLHQQTGVWATGYVIYALLIGYLTLKLPREALALTNVEGASELEESAAKPGAALHLYWIALAAVASMLLLAVTSHLSQNVAAIPFLWVVPLSLYLVSFIVCFGPAQWEWSQSFVGLPPLALGAMAYALLHQFENPSVAILIPVFAFGLFICCLLCHGELARLKPAPRFLTSYYLMISIGGALGGVFVVLIAPRLFTGYYELPLGLVLCALIAVGTVYRESNKTGWGAARVTMALLTVVLAFFLWLNVRQDSRMFRLNERNFYGVLRVNDEARTNDPTATRSLTNGTINHGDQFLDPKRRDEPTTYYAPESGIGLAIQAKQQEKAGQGIKVGVIGLGTGTLAAYGLSGDTYRFYEINPLVIKLSQSLFTFVPDCKAQKSIALGDARLSLEKEPPQGYDVLAVDAFASDSIPIHLLTHEAFALYFRHLKPDGVLAVHISNRFLDLQPVVTQEAAQFGKPARLISASADESRDVFASEWVLVAADPHFFDHALIKDNSAPAEANRRLRLWTDDYSNLFQIVKWDG